ncbi:MAG TPA: hypothetical protein VMW66_04365 [Elusimicrobiales bacterium]|nr:hypothetical protein [Elusimicrobiales bacterium]
MKGKTVEDVIRKNLGKYPLDEIKQYLFNQKISPQEFDYALRKLILNPKKNRLDILLSAFFLTVIAICAAIIIPEVKNLSDYIASQPKKSEQFVTFRSTNNFSMQLPYNYKFFRKKNKEGIETAIFHLKSIPIEKLKEWENGVYRLNSIPRESEFSDTLLDLKTMRTNHIRLAKQQNLKFKLSAVENMPFPAFILRVYGKNAYSELVMEGKVNIYVYASSKEDDTFYKIIKSLQEY